MVELCEVCGTQMDEHLKCDSCGILIGPSHLYHTEVKRGNFVFCDGCSGLLNSRAFFDPLGTFILFPQRADKSRAK